MWDDQGDVLIGKFFINDWKPSKHITIVMFDLDDTLIEPNEKIKPGAPYTKWKFCKGVTKKLTNLNASLVIIISNQAKLDKYKESFQAKLEEMIHKFRELKITVPILLYVANKYNKYRKPSTGIITEYLIPFLNENGVEKITEWCYIGDAAGRKNDHSDSDRKFAININLISKRKNKINNIYVPGVIFMEPETYFLNHKPSPFVISGFDPHKFLNKFLKQTNKKLKMSELDLSIDYLKSNFSNLNTQEVVMLIGPPGIGKSTLAKRIERNWNYVRINQDNLGSKSAVNKELLNVLKSGKSVVLDSTNNNIKRRQEQISIASDYFKEHKKPINIRAFVLAGDLPINEQKALAQHLNIMRERSINKQRVPNIAYTLYYKDYMPPSEEEGFTEIKNVKFVPRFIKPENVLDFLQKT